MPRGFVDTSGMENQSAANPMFDDPNALRAAAGKSMAAKERESLASAAGRSAPSAQERESLASAAGRSVTSTSPYAVAAAGPVLTSGPASRAVSNSSWMTSTYTNAGDAGSVAPQSFGENMSQASQFSNTFGVDVVPIQNRFSTVLEEDDLVNTKVDLDGRGNQNEVFLRPGKYDSLGNKVPQRPPGCKGFCCGTPRRKFTCYTVGLIVMAFLTFLTARAIDAFRITQTDPVIAQLGVSSLCDSILTVPIVVEMDNPSSIGATLRAMSSQLIIDGEVVADVDSGEIEFKSGYHVYELPLVAKFRDGQIPHVKEIVQRWVSGEDIPFEASLPIRAYLPPSVFLFPITLPVTLGLESQIRGLGFEYENPKPVDPDAPVEYEPEEAIAKVDLLPTNAPGGDDEYIVARVALNLMDRATLKDTTLNLVLPSLTLDLEVEGMHAAIIQTEPFHMGQAEFKPDGYPLQPGVVAAKAALGWQDVDGINEALRRIMADGPGEILITVKGRAITTPDMSPGDHDRNVGEQCFIQTLVEGLVYNQVLPLYDYEDATVNTQTEYEAAAFLDFRRVQLVQGYPYDYKYGAGVWLNVDAGIQGLLNLYKFEGTLPNLKLNVTSQTKEMDQSDRYEVAMVTLDNLNQKTAVQEVDHLNNVLAYYSPKTIAGNWQVAEDFLTGAELWLGVTMDPTYNLASALLSGHTFMVPLHEYEYEERIERERAVFLNETLNDDPQFIRLDVESDDTYVETWINATSITSESLGGLTIELPELEIHLDAFNPWTEEYERVFYLYVAPFSSGFTKPDLSAFLSAKDETSGGALVRDVVLNITQLEPIPMYGRMFVNGNKRFQDDFVLVRDPKPEFVSKNAEVAADTSAFVLYEAELWALQNSEVETIINFGLDLGGVQLEINLPKIAISAGRCNAPPDAEGRGAELVAFIVDPFSFTSVSNTSIPVPLNIAPRNASEVMETLRVLSSSDEPTEFCISGHPDEGNFLSYVIGSLELDIALGGESDEPASAANLTDAITIDDFVLESDAVSACTAVSVTLDTSEIEDNSTAFGWGDMNMTWDHNVIATGIPYTSVLNLVVDNGYIGPNTPYNIERFNAPVDGIQPIAGELCLSKDWDPEVSIDEGAAAVRIVLQRLLDGAGIQIVLDGELKPRIESEVPLDSYDISGAFGLPPNLIDSFATVAEANDITVETVTDWFAFRKWELTSWNGLQITMDLTLETGDLGFLITLPEIRGRLASKDKTTGVVTDLFEVYATMPPFGKEEAQLVPITVTIVVSDYADLFDFGTKLLNSEANILVGYSKAPEANFISKCIPEIVFSFDELEEVEETTGEDTFRLEARLGSTSTSATLTLIFEALVRFDTLFQINALNFNLCDGPCVSSNVLGTWSSPQVLLQEIGSGLNAATFTLSGSDAFDTVGYLWTGLDVPLGFSGTIGGLPFVADFVLPASFLEPAAVGTEESSTDVADSLTADSLTILGGDNVGDDVTLPCLVTDICQNLIKDEDSGLTITGLTIGVALGFDLGNLVGGLVWDLYLDSDLWVIIGLNGFDIGTVALRAPAPDGMHISSTDEGLNPIVSMFLDSTAENIKIVRESLDLLLGSYDTIISVRGSDISNSYLSALFQQVVQDIEFVGGDPNAEYEPGEALVPGDLFLSLRQTTRNRADIGVLLPFRWNVDTLVLAIGDLDAKIRYGHTGPSDAGEVIGGVTSDFPLVFTPNPTPFDLTLGAYGEWSTTAQYDQIGVAIGNVLFKIDVQLEIQATITPPVNPFDAARTPFTLTTFLTFQQFEERPEDKDPDEPTLINGIEIDILGTLWQSIGDVMIVADLVVQNTLDFPLLISYAELGIYLYDLDGVRSGQCNGISGGLVSGINACAWLGAACGAPWFTPQNIEENDDTIKAGNANNPLASALKTPGGSPVELLGVLELGGARATVDVTINQAGRLLDEYLAKDQLCGDIRNGVLHAGVRANPASCSDNAGTAEVNLQCTFVGKVPFALPNYALSSGDTCGVFMTVPFSAGYSAFSSLGVYQHKGGDGGGIRSSFTLTDGSEQSQTEWDNGGTMSTNDPFRISFNFRVASACAFGNGESFSLMYRNGRPFSQRAPTIVSDGVSCSFFGGCDDRYGFKGVGLGVAGMIFTSGTCNSLALCLHGDIGTVYKSSQSICGSNLDNGDTHKVTIVYDNVGRRMQVRMNPSSGDDANALGRVFELDQNFQLTIGNTIAYLGFGASTGYYGCSTQTISNFKIETVRTDSTSTTTAEPPVLPYENTAGVLRIQAADTEGRPRGAGGNTWTGQLYEDDGVTPVGGVIPEGAFTDLNDGTYNMAYTAPARGRYIVKVRCTSSASGPNQCINAGAENVEDLVLFIRKEPSARRRLRELPEADDA